MIYPPHPLFIALALACVSAMVFAAANMLHARDRRFYEVPSRGYPLHFLAVAVAIGIGAANLFTHPHIVIILAALVLMIGIAGCEGMLAVKALRGRMKRVKTE